MLKTVVMKLFIKPMALLLISFPAFTQPATYISPTAKINVLGNISIWGDVTNSANTLQSGNFIIADTARVIFYGTSWINNNASDIAGGPQSLGTISFVGPRPAPYAGNFSQSLNGGGEDQSFPAISIANPNNLQLSNTATRVRSKLTFAVDEGHIISNGNNLVLGNGASPATIDGYNPVRYFVTNICGVGHLVRTGFGTMGGVFPVGRAEGDYTPALIMPNSNARVWVNVCDYATSPANEGALMTKGMNRTWNIFAGAPVEVQVALQHNTSTNNMGGGGAVTYNDTEAFIVRSSSTGSWEGYLDAPASFTQGNLQDGGAAIPGTALHRRNYTLSNNNSTLSYYTKDHSGQPLPASGLVFTGRYSSGNVLLSWKSLSEYNLSHYNITRSTDGVQFTPIGSQKATNRGNAAYLFNDNVGGLSASRLYYRLQPTDVDGRFQLSDIVVLNIDAKARMSIYPNPASSTVNITLPSAINQNAELILYNAHGQAVKRQMLSIFSGNQTISLNGLDKLATGQYQLFLKLKNGETIRHQLIIKH